MRQNIVFARLQRASKMFTADPDVSRLATFLLPLPRPSLSDIRMAANAFLRGGHQKLI